MSRYWILTIGLLGRYGDREDGGKETRPTIRPDLNEERTLLGGSDRGSDIESEFEAALVARNDDSLVGDDHDDHDGSHHKDMICGVTRSVRKMRYVYRDVDGNESKLTSPLSFNLHNRHEQGRIPQLEVLTLASIFWVANSFIPLPAPGSSCACLEDPISDLVHEDESTEHADSGGETATTIPRLYVLSVAKERPRSIRLAAEAFGMIDTTILYWKDVTSEISAGHYFRRAIRTHPSGADPGIIAKETNAKMSDLQDFASGKTSANKSRFVSTDGGGEGAFVLREDLETMVSAFLCIEWSSLSYVIWKHNTNFFTDLLYTPQLLCHPCCPFSGKLNELPTLIE